MLTLKEKIYTAVFSVLLCLLGLGGLHILSSTGPYFGGCAAAQKADDTRPEFTKDLQGKVVAVVDPKNPVQIVGWYFDPQDTISIKFLDQREEGHKHVYYIQVDTKTKTGHLLSGIAETYYITVAGKQYLVAIGSVNLKMTLPPEKTNSQSSQKLPGK